MILLKERIIVNYLCNIIYEKKKSLLNKIVFERPPIITYLTSVGTFK